MENNMTTEYLCDLVSTEDNGITLKALIDKLNEILEDNPNAVIEVEDDYYGAHADINVLRPMTPLEIKHRDINNLTDKILFLQHNRANISKEFINEEVMIDNGEKITEAQVLEYKSKFPTAQFALRNFGYILVRKHFDEELYAIKFGEIGVSIKDLEDKLSVLQKDYDELKKEDNIE